MGTYFPLLSYCTVQICAVRRFRVSITNWLGATRLSRLNRIWVGNDPVASSVNIVPYWTMSGNLLSFNWLV